MIPLTCRMKGHESYLIHGMCQDENCKAQEKLICFYCIKQFHSACHNNYYTEEEMKLKMKEHLDKYTKENNINNSLVKIKDQFTQLQSTNEYLIHTNNALFFQKSQELGKLFQAYQTNNLSQMQWYNGYKFIKDDNPLQIDQTLQLQIMNNYIQDTKETFQQLLSLKHSMLFPKQKMQNQTVKCNWSEGTLIFDWQVENEQEEEEEAEAEAEDENNESNASQDEENQSEEDQEQAQEVAGESNPDEAGESKSDEEQEVDEDEEQEDQYSNSFNMLSISCSNNGKYICFGGTDKKLYIWDPEKQRQVMGDMLHQDEILSVAFSPDSKHIVSSDAKGLIKIWETHTGKQICKSIVSNSGQVWTVSYSPNGSQIVCGTNDSSILRYNSLTGKQIGKTLQGHKAPVGCVRYSPDGKSIVSGSMDKTVRVWNIRTEKEQYAPLYGHRGGVGTVGYSLKGEFIISGSGDYTIRLWQSSNGQFLRQIDLITVENINSISISRDGLTFASAHDKLMTIWDFQGRKIQDLYSKNCVNEICYSPDGNYLAAAKDNNQVQIIDLRNSI